MYNEKPNLSFAKVYGCVAVMHIEKPFCNKIDQTSNNGIFFGNSDNSKCSLVGFEDKKVELKIRKSIIVRSNENEFYTSNIRKHKNLSKTLIMIQMKSLF